MVNSIEYLNEQEFVTDFIKKLESILKTAPIQAKARIVSSKVEIEVLGFDENIIYIIDYNLDVKVNIHNLKSMLQEKRYPSIDILTYSKEKYSPQEIEDFISKGIPLSEALLMIKEVKTAETYIISKVIIPKDLVFLQNPLDEGDNKLYKLKMPLSVFLKRMRSKWTKEEASEMFSKNAEFVKIIYPSKVWHEMNEVQSRVEVVNE